jgi:hypothetical protein
MLGLETPLQLGLMRGEEVAFVCRGEMFWTPLTFVDSRKIDVPGSFLALRLLKTPHQLFADMYDRLFD